MRAAGSRPADQYVRLVTMLRYFEGIFKPISFMARIASALPLASSTGWCVRRLLEVLPAGERVHHEPRVQVADAPAAVAERVAAGASRSRGCPTRSSADPGWLRRATPRTAASRRLGRRTFRARRACVR